jgi:ribosomal protein S27AE
MAHASHDAVTGTLSYSTRSCPRCGIGMASSNDSRGRRTWQCSDCGIAKR